MALIKNKRKMFPSIPYIVLSGTMIAACCYFFFQPGWGFDKSDALISTRIVFGYILFSIFAVLFFDKLLLQSRLLHVFSVSKTALLALFCFLALTTVQDIRFSLNFKEYLDNFYSVVNQPTAEVLTADAARKRFSGTFQWPWTNELTSVVLADKYPFTMILSAQPLKDWVINKERNKDPTRPRIIERSPAIAKNFSWN
jgi:hypothetical protein